MAAPIGVRLSRLFLSETRPIYSLFSRSTVWDSRFIEPTKSVEEIHNPLAADDERRFHKIKPASLDTYTFADYDPVLQKFSNMLMKDGRKQMTREIIAKTFQYIKHVQLEKYHTEKDEVKKNAIELDPFVIFHTALENGKPILMTKKVRKSGQKIQVPVPCPPRRATFLSMRWLIKASEDKKKQRRLHDKLGQEIINAFNFEGGLIRKKQEMHKICEANKALASLAY
ncbi:28S ribosomal protein S7, mitochondrial-like [Mya arenaria]|uniref:28S ribosomal protein S7, mitochondrial-like n=1 Tax=Mya arenaria TaxID=6604 RepID=UPI0022E3193F|nr:28S ribosomal protein S7, mitochondrial-like [Mya arenaria]